jgi:hypothetical protein
MLSLLITSRPSELRLQDGLAVLGWNVLAGGDLQEQFRLIGEAVVEDGHAVYLVELAYLLQVLLGLLQPRLEALVAFHSKVCEPVV